VAVYGYRRVSGEGQEDGSSLDEQEVKIRALCALQGLGEPTVFGDVCSGSVALGQRQGGKVLLEALRPGDCLVVAKLDRIFRSATDALVQADALAAKEVKLYLIDLGAEPLTGNGATRIFFGLLALVAEFERERIAERTADGRRAKRSKGGHIGGARPFGYRVQGKGKAAVLVPDEAEQGMIALARTMRREGRSLRSISEALKAQGHQLSHVGVARIVQASAAA